jgi:hypothetical protein
MNYLRCKRNIELKTYGKKQKEFIFFKDLNSVVNLRKRTTIKMIKKTLLLRIMLCGDGGSFDRRILCHNSGTL